LFSKFFASALLSNASEFYFCNILFLTLIFEITQEVPLSYLRAQEKSVFFVSISFLQLIVRISLNVFMVVKLQWGVAGVLAGNLYSAAFIWLILNLYLLYKVGLKFSSKTFQILFKYSFPLLGGSIMGILILNADRFFLKSLSGLSTLGIYAIGYKMAMIVQMFIIQPFTTAYGPFRFSIIQEENAKKIYSFIFTYFILIVSFFGLGISVFARDIIARISTSDFIEAYRIVPILTLAVVFQGMDYIAQTGIFVQKKTFYISLIMLRAVILNLILNFILIRFFDMSGAAWALLCTWVFIFFNTLYYAQRVYAINIDYKRIMKIVLCVLMIYSSSVFIFHNSIFAKLAIYLLYPVMLLCLGFFRDEEKKRMVAIVNSMWRRK